MAGWRKRRVEGSLLAIALAVTSCGSVNPTSWTASDGTFVVTVSVPPGTHHAADALELVATVTYVGPEKMVTVDGDDRGLVSFTFKQLDGSREMGGLSDLMCSPPVSLQRGSPATFRPDKSVAYQADDPNAAFYARWASEPDLRLPAGRWMIQARALIWEAEWCIGAARSLHTITPAALIVDVVP